MVARAAPQPFPYTRYLGQDELLHRLVPQLVHLHTAARGAETSHKEGLLQMGVGGRDKKKDFALDTVYVASFQASSTLGSLILDGLNQGL